MSGQSLWRAGEAWGCRRTRPIGNSPDAKIIHFDTSGTILFLSLVCHLRQLIDLRNLQPTAGPDDEPECGYVELGKPLKAPTQATGCCWGGFRWAPRNRRSAAVMEVARRGRSWIRWRLRVLFGLRRNCKNRGFYGGKRAYFCTRQLENEAELSRTRGLRWLRGG